MRKIILLISFCVLSVFANAQQFVSTLNVPFSGAVYDVAIDNNDNRIVLGRNPSGTINIYNSLGTLTSTFGLFLITFPRGIDVDNSGNIFVATGDASLRIYNYSGTLLNTFTSAGGSISDVSFSSSDGNLYVVDSFNRKLLVLSTGGTLVREIPFSLSEIPLSITTSSANVYVHDMASDKVKVYRKSDGVYLFSCGSGTGSGNGQFQDDGSVPRHNLAVDGAGYLYVTDCGNNRVQMFDGDDGSFVRTFGAGGAANGNFDHPRGIAISSNQRIFVADDGNRRVQEFYFPGVQGMVFDFLPDKAYGDAPFNLSAFAAIGPVSYTSSNTAVATVSGNTVTVVGVGTTVIKAVQVGSATYHPCKKSQFLTVTKGNPSLHITSSSSGVYSETISLTTNTGGSTGVVTYSVNNGTGSATVSGNTLSLTGAGTVLVWASITADQNFNAGYVGQNVTIYKADPIVSITSSNTGTQNGTISLTTDKGGSTGAVTYAVANGTGSATLTGSTLTLSSVGTVTVTATVATDANYNGASTTQTITINDLPIPVISITSAATGIYGGTIPLTTNTGGSTGAVTYSVANGTGSATLSGNTLSLDGAGTVTVTSSVAGDANYNPATATQVITINKADPVVSITSANSGSIGDVIPLTVNTGAYTGVVTFSVVDGTGSASLSSGNNLNLLTAGTVTVTASVSSDANYNTASATQVITTNKLSSSIVITSTNTGTYGGSVTLTSTATGSSGSVTYAVVNGTGNATVTGSTLDLTGAGTVTVTANLAADASHESASASQVVTISKANQTITFTALADKTKGDAAFLLTASSSSGLAVGYAVNSAIATVSGNQLTLVNAGRVTITASQPGNSNYNAATSVTQSFCINPAKPVITASFANAEAPVLTSSNTAGNQWYLDGSSINGAASSTLTVSHPGSYTVQSTVDDCRSALSDPKIIVVTSIEQLPETALSLYPNPSSERITIQIDPQIIQGQHVNVAIHDMVGKTIGQGGEEMLNRDIDVSSLRAGVYLVKVGFGAGTKVIKFIKN